jgi:hypothetical protein
MSQEALVKFLEERCIDDNEADGSYDYEVFMAFDNWYYSRCGMRIPSLRDFNRMMKDWDYDLSGTNPPRYPGITINRSLCATDEYKKSKGKKAVRSTITPSSSHYSMDELVAIVKSVMELCEYSSAMIPIDCSERSINFRAKLNSKCPICEAVHINGEWLSFDDGTLYCRHTRKTLSVDYKTEPLELTREGILKFCVPPDCIIAAEGGIWTYIDRWWHGTQDAVVKKINTMLYGIGWAARVKGVSVDSTPLERRERPNCICTPNAIYLFNKVNEWIFAHPGDAINVVTGEVRPLIKSDMANALCPEYDMKMSFNCQYKILQRALGYMVLGHNPESLFFIILLSKKGDGIMQAMRSAIAPLWLQPGASRSIQKLAGRRVVEYAPDEKINIAELCAADFVPVVICDALPRYSDSCPNIRIIKLSGAFEYSYGMRPGVLPWILRGCKDFLSDGWNI